MPTGIRTLKDAILAGCAVTKPTIASIYNGYGCCALGAALVGIGVPLEKLSNREDWYDFAHSTFGTPNVTTMWHMNDLDKDSREKIADYFDGVVLPEDLDSRVAEICK